MPSKSFSTNFSGRIRIEPTELSLAKDSDRPTLNVPIHMFLDRTAFDTSESCLLFDLQGTMIGGSNTNRLAKSERFPVPRTIYEKGEITFNLRFPISEKAALAIEESRKGDALLSFQIKPVFASHARATIDMRNGTKSTHTVLLGSFEDATIELTFPIPQSHWINDILPGLEVTRSLLLEFPRKGIVFLDAWNHLEKAESSYHGGDQKGVFAHSREAGVALDNSIKDKLGATSYAYIEKWGRAYKHFSHLASLHLHVEEKKPLHPTQEVLPSKADAEIVLFTVKAMARYAEQLARPLPSSN